MGINIQYNFLDETDGSIRMEIEGTADFIVARRVGDTNTAQILDEVVSPSTQGKGSGRELVETLLDKCVSCGITTVEIKENQNPSWWEKAKSFRKGYMIRT